MTNMLLKSIMQNNPQVWTVNAIFTQHYGQVLLFDQQRACLNVTDFYFIEGSFSESFGQELIRCIKPPAMITSSNHEWYRYWMEQTNTYLKSERVSRRMYQWTGRTHMLAPYLQVTPSYSIHRIDRHLAEKILLLEWAEGVFDAYGDMSGFLEHGFGYCLLHQDKVVSLCLSYAHSDDGIEIEVDTDPAYHGRGLAKIVSAHFVSESLRRGIKPLWDASHLPSAKLAESIGFELMREYEAVWSTSMTTAL